MAFLGIRQYNQNSRRTFAMPKHKRTLILAGIVLPLIVFLLFLPTYFIWIPGIRLDRKISALHKAGLPVCMADLARTPIPPERNSATYFHLAAKDLIAAEKIFAALPDYPNLFFQLHKGRYKSEEIKTLQDAIAAYPDIDPLLQKAADCPEFGLQWDFNSGSKKYIQQLNNEPLWGAFWTSIKYIDARANVLLFQGKRDEALQSAVLLLQLSRRMELEPLCYLISLKMTAAAIDCANEVLQSGPVGDEYRKKWDAELALHGSTDKYLEYLQTHQAIDLDFVRERYPSPYSSFGQRNEAQLAVLGLYEAFCGYIAKPFSECAGSELMQIYDPGRFVKTFPQYFYSAKYEVLPKLQQALRETYRSQALIRSMRILNALQKINPGESNANPTITELGLPDDVGIDPFNGKPMIIKKLPEGWLVYSVGENLQDDGGKVEEELKNGPLDVGFGPKTAKPQLKEKESVQ
jgi:hypothetical protein